MCLLVLTTQPSYTPATTSFSSLTLIWKYVMSLVCLSVYVWMYWYVHNDQYDRSSCSSQEVHYMSTLNSEAFKDRFICAHKITMSHILIWFHHACVQPLAYLLNVLTPCDCNGTPIAISLLHSLPSRSPLYSLALVDSSTLVIGSVDQIQMLHIDTISLGESPK